MPKKLERCVKKVQRSKGKDSAWAICTASIKGKKDARKTASRSGKKR